MCVCVNKSTWRRTAVIELRCDLCKFWQRDFRLVWPPPHRKQGTLLQPLAANPLNGDANTMGNLDEDARIYFDCQFSPLVGRWICFWDGLILRCELLVPGRVVRLSVQLVESCIQCTWSQLILLIQTIQWMSIDIVKQLPVGNTTMNCYMPVGNPKFS